MAKRKARKAVGARVARPLVLDFQIRRALEEAEELGDNQDWAGVRRLLQPVLRRAPANLQVMEELAYVYFELSDWPSYIDLAEHIRARTPDRADIYLSLAGAATNAAYVCLAMRHLRAFIARFPYHPEQASAAEQLQALQSVASALLAEMRAAGGFPPEGEAAARILEEHEWMQVQLAAGHPALAQELGETLLQRLPEWPPVLNNLSIAVGLQCRHAEALAYADRVLALRPDDVFAACERIKRLYLLGRTEEARAAAAQVAQTIFQGRRDDGVVKLAEALALLGDDAGLIALYERAEESGRPAEPLRRAILLRLTGAAHARRGDSATARALWQKALEAAPASWGAKESLLDLERPPAERHGPFLLDSAVWLPRSWALDLCELARGRKDDVAVRTAARRFLAERPGLVPLLGPLLDRGDEAGRLFALTVCRMAETPETLAALRDFALGQHGTDQQRTDALTEVMNTAFQVREKVRMWVRGEWVELQPIGFEITREPLRRHPPHVEPLVEQATTALGRNDLATAEQALNAALTEEPDAPDLLNNLAMLRSRQGREAEAEAIVEDLRERFPTYSFAIFNTAQGLLAKGKAKRALDLLQPVLRRKQLHLSEFTNLCAIQIRALLMLGQLEDAHSWFKMLSRQAPSHPLVTALRSAFRQTAALGEDLYVSP